MEDTNIFLATALAVWKDGGDGEEIASDLAEAFAAITKHGQGRSLNRLAILQEFARLCPEDPIIVDHRLVSDE